jgi:hypothetical protein
MRRLLAGVLALAGAVLCSACGGTTVAGTAQSSAIQSPVAQAPAAPSLPAGPTFLAAPSLADSRATSQATWAVLPMGAPSGANEFWQLFVQTTGRQKWTLDTPPDIATNGAIALGGVSGMSLIAGVRPSLDLAFSPVSRTSDAGQHWTAGPPAAGLSSVPDALAANPAGSRLLALSSSGQVSTASPGGTAWTSLITQRSLAVTAAGRRCGLAQLTAVSYTPAEVPLAAASCSRPGIAGIFALAGGSWHAAGPRLPPSLADYQVRVLRLVTSSSATVALLQAVRGSQAVLAAAWLDQRGRWTLSPALNVEGSAVRTTAFGSSGAVAVALSGASGASGASGLRGEVLAGPGRSWRPTPPLPAARIVTLALPPGGPADALAASAGTVTVWQLSSGWDSWTELQTIKVPIQYGSSH